MGNRPLLVDAALCDRFPGTGSRGEKHSTPIAMLGAVLLCVPLFCAPAGAQVTGSDHLKTSAGTVDIVIIHHATLRLDFKDQHILIDPAPLDGAQGDAVT